ncbi:MAG: site-specific integrase [Deltaproteobacteria bacterium]|nr:site-specific integrase [Deltaproteobacteria bacterium]
MGKKECYVAGPAGVKRTPDGNFLIRIPHKIDPETGAIKRTWKKVYVNTVKKAVEIREALVRDFHEKMRWGRVEKDPHLTFRDLVDWYLKHPQIQRQNPNTYSKKMAYLKFWKKQFGGIRVVAIRAEMIENAMNLMLKSNNAAGRLFKPATVNRYFASLRHCFSMGVRKGTIENNPCKGVVALDEDNIRDIYLERRDLDRILSVSAPHIKDIALVGWYLGMRVGEILNLQKSWVNMEKGYLVLPPRAHKSGKKTKKWRMIPFGMFKEVVEIFKRNMALEHPHHTYVFTYRGKPIVSIRKAWERARGRAGMPEVWFHDLRRSANTKMDQEGVSRSVIKAITGHATDSMFERYRPVPDSEVFEAMRRYNEKLVREGSVFRSTNDQDRS